MDAQDNIVYPLYERGKLEQPKLKYQDQLKIGTFKPSNEGIQELGKLQVRYGFVNLTKKEVKFFTGERTKKSLELVTKSTSQCLC